MTTSLAFCANTRVCLIGLPRTESIDDPQSSPQAAVDWHFGPDTRSRYWLNRVKTLDFTSLAEAMAEQTRRTQPLHQHPRPRPARNPQPNLEPPKGLHLRHRRVRPRLGRRA